ncbi:tubulin-dependent ATPase kip3 [Coemansia javaensis]|uniref:Kinesin-like protein KIN-8B n=1 Tax=Coemansia javaensis TaxID=2761396 RepID=A0A9W8LIG1_9FUNG|nr:tubulin-dependent ATPase kip3 [Coemansia javaensis]
MVAVRVRPFSDKERALLPPPPGTPFGLTARNLLNYAAGDEQEDNDEGERARAGRKATIRKVVHPIDGHVLVFDPPDENDGDRRAPVAASNKRHKDIRFVFDRVYGEESTQREVYEGTTRGLLDAVMSGYNATVFAYGATGCGKTYTISGSAEDPGVIPLTMQELFERVAAAEDERAIEVALSYLEVYNETIRDLLVDGGGGAMGLALREDARQGVTVAGLSEHVPGSVGEVMGLMERGNANRTMSPTEANAVSSRSHAVMQVHVRQRAKAGGLQTDVTTATLSIIDLAGSERATVARNNGARMREGANINRSLLALANCINALCDQRTKRHIPYRDSKLTRLLKFSLGGNCRTVMITCVSPASTYYEETHNTLKYANRAKNIKTTVARNTRSAQVHLAQYQGKIREQSDEIKRLQREIAALKSRPAAAAAGAGGGGVRNSVQAAQAMAELRKQTQAIQVVQDLRNKMAAAYAPIREAKWEHASALMVGGWYDHHLDALKGWREQFETAFQEQQHLFSPGSGMDVDQADDDANGDDGGSGSGAALARRSLVFRQQVDELLRDLTRERKTVGRHAEHSEQVIERNAYMAERAAQVPPAVQLTGEQRYHVDQEHRLLDLTAERGGLRRQVELGEHIAGSLARQNALLLRLTATCLCSLKRAMHDAQAAALGQAAPGAVERVLEQVYMQAISSFGEVTGSIRAAMRQVRDQGGPAKMVVSGSALAPPSPYVRPPAAGAASRAGAAASTSSAISAAVAGTTRARRAVAPQPQPAAPAPGRHLRSTPPKRSQAVLGRAAVRFGGGDAAAAGGARTRASTRAAQAAAAATLAAAGARRNSGGGGGGGAARAARGGRKAAAAAAAVAAATDGVGRVTVGSPGTRKAATSFAVGDASLPSPTVSAGSVSPASSVGSWSSAGPSPHHEPLPAGARPLKGILKQQQPPPPPAQQPQSPPLPPGAGPIRLGSARRKSRHARVLANPTARTAGSTPPRPPTAAAAASSRELFKSVAPAAAQQPKRPVWR